MYFSDSSLGTLDAMHSVEHVTVVEIRSKTGTSTTVQPCDEIFGPPGLALPRGSICTMTYAASMAITSRC